MTASGPEKGKGKTPHDPETPLPETKSEEGKVKDPSASPPEKGETAAPEPGSADAAAGPEKKVPAEGGAEGAGEGEGKGGLPGAGEPADPPEPEKPHPYEELLDDYPLREPGEDPVWSVRIVKGWMWFLAITAGGIILLTILGFFYD